MNETTTPYESLDLPGKVKNRLGNAVSLTKLKFQMFTEFDKVFNQSGMDQDANAQIHNPYSWSTIETITPRLVAKKPTVTYSPATPDNQQQEMTSKAMQGLFDHWYVKDKVFTKLVSWVKASELYGTSHVKLYWKTEKKIVKSYEYGEDGLPKLDGKKLAVKEEEITTFDDPTLENVNIYHLFVDPNATDLSNARWVIHRYYKTVDELESVLENGKPVYKNLDQLRNHLKQTIDSDSPEDSLRHEYSFLRRNRVDKTVDLVTCLEMWDMEDNTVCTIAEGEIIIRPKQPLPFWHGRLPFVRLLDSVVPHEYYGKGEIEPVLKQQYALDTMDSLVVDNAIELQMNMWKVSGDIDESELRSRPNGVIHFDATLGESVEEVTRPNIIAPGLQAREQLKADMQQALGITDYTQGADSTADRTATGTNIKAQSQNARFAHKIQLFEEALEEVGYQVMALYQQFMTEPKDIKVQGSQGNPQQVRLTPQQIAGQFTSKVEAGSSSPVDKDAQREDALNLYQLLGHVQDPEIQYQLTRELVQTFNFPGLMQAVERSHQQQTEQGQQGGPQDPVIAQRDQQHQQQLAQADQQHQMNLQHQEQQHQQQIQMKLAEMQNKLEIEKMKTHNAMIQKQQAPHVTEFMAFKDMPAVAKDALLTSVGLPAGAQSEQQNQADQALQAKNQPQPSLLTNK